MPQTQTIDYGGIFFSCFSDDGVSCTDRVRNHTLTYVYAGELEIDNNGKRIVVGKNQCVFVPRDHRIRLVKRAASQQEQYRGISLTFDRAFLREFYAQLPKKELPAALRRSVGILKLTERPDAMSLFESLRPYLDSGAVPTPEVLGLKRLEGVYTLLRADQALYAVLFDFTQPWKIDLMGFMEENYRCDLSMEEIAAFTGRSLAAFKRDFAKISDLSPQKWIVRRRLQAAYDALNDEHKKAADIYTEVGFKDISHFYRAFKRQYGFSPRQ